MLIRVRYREGAYDMVKEYFLANLIASGRISRFRRTDGWVEIGRDPVRRHPAPRRIYTGPERRDPITHRPLETLIRIGGQVYRPCFSGRPGSE
ncbi:MAG: hypothetical protein WDA20_07180 [Desulfuromonadales bacterium]